MAATLVVVFLHIADPAPHRAVLLRHARPSDVRPIAELLAAPAEPVAPPPIGGAQFRWEEQSEVARWLGVLPSRLVPSADHLFAVVADEVTGEIVGCAELGLVPAPAHAARESERAPHAAERVAYVGNLAVASAQRRRGLARRLVGFACKWARSQWHRPDVFTHVDAANAPARALYAALGFCVYEGSMDGAAPARLGAGQSERAGQVLLVRHAPPPRAEEGG